MLSTTHNCHHYCLSFPCDILNFVERDNLRSCLAAHTPFVHILSFFRPLAVLGLRSLPIRARSQRRAPRGHEREIPEEQTS